MTFFGSPIGSRIGDGARRDSVSSLGGTLDNRLNIPRLPCFDGEPGGLGFGIGRSVELWKRERFGCCSRTPASTSPWELVSDSSWACLGFKAWLSLAHMSQEKREGHWALGEGWVAAARDVRSGSSANKQTTKTTRAPTVT